MTVLDVHPTSEGMDPATLLPGRHLVLRLPPRHGAALADGVLVDDHLDAAARARVDADALADLESWREAVDDALTVDGVSFADLWHGELYAEVFLETHLVLTAIEAAVRDCGPDVVRCHGLDAGLVRHLGRRLAPVEVQLVDSGPHHALAPPLPAPSPWWQRSLRRLMDLTGVPPVVRPGTLVLAYGTTVPVLARLAAGEGPRPIVHLPFPPPAALVLRAARRGGWTGIPGAGSRKRARAGLDAGLRALAASRPGFGSRDDGLADLLHSRAIRFLGERGVDEVAGIRSLDRMFRRGRIRSVLLPFDYQPVAKVLIRLAQRHGVPVLSLQHGYQPRPIFTSGWVADHAGLFSDWDVTALPAGRRAAGRVVGNPLAGPEQPAVRTMPAGRRRVIVLVQHHDRSSAAVDRRIPARHLGTALAGLVASGEDWDIVIRPHPSDDPAEYVALAATLGAATVDTRSSALDLLRGADLCIGATSTVSLQTLLTGTRMVMLNVTGVPWAPPLDGTGGVPLATDAASLATAVTAVLAAAEQPGLAALRTGLGMDVADPAGEVIGWLSRLSVGRVS